MSDPLRPLRVPGVSSLPEGEARKVRYQHGGETRELLVARVKGRLLAADTYCPHEGGRLSEGPLAQGRYGVCPLHLYRFDLATGACKGVECDPLTVYRVEEVDGEARVWVEDEAP